MAHVAKPQHRCPAGGTARCTRYVPDRIFACPEHWFKLPADVRQDIERTASLPSLHADRRAAIAAALDAWKGTPRGEVQR